MESNNSVLRVEDVFKIYSAGGEETVALRGASLEIGRGEFVALLGRSGSGKSSLLNVMSGLDTPSAGRVYLGGSDITRLDEEERAAIRRRTVGIVLQRDNLVPYLSALENVELPLRLAQKDQAKERAENVLQSVGLTARMHHRAHQLSGGEAQRVSIALALAPEPQLLLADEITGELDSETANSILNLLSDMHEHYEMSLLVVTHDGAVAARADRLLLMRDGIVETTPVSQEA